MCNGNNHCGYGYSWIGVWKSDTMADGSWTLVREARDDSWPRNIYFRVHVVFNKRTHLYVMWANLNGGKADYAVGTSSDPEGPFKFVTYANAAVSGGGDFDILVDDDAEASAFIIYTSTQTGHTMSLEKLDPTYTQSLTASKPPPSITLEKGETLPVLEPQINLGKRLAWYSDSSSRALSINSSMPIVGGPVKSNVSSGIIGMPFVEAPAIFKRNGVYYALFGNCCCFCGQGSGIGVHTARHPLGPWTWHENIGCNPGFNSSSTHGCGMGNGYGNSLTKAQQNFVIPVETVSGVTEYIWTGDRWQSGGCPDPHNRTTCKPDDGIKYMDLQYWSPLTWIKDPKSGLDLPMQLSWLDSFVIDMKVGS